MIKCCECDKELPDKTEIEAYIEDKRMIEEMEKAKEEE